MIRLKNCSYLVLFVGILAGLYSCQSENTSDRKVLVFSKTRGWYHTSIPSGIKAIMELGKEGNFLVDTTKNADFFNDENLKKYDAVIFLSTTGDVLNPEQQAAFERYIQAGGGYVGIHSAACTEYEWPWFGQLMGAHFANHPHNPGVREATVLVKDKDHPSASGLPDNWVRNDEWYNYKFFYPGIKVVASLDETTYVGGTHGSNHPIAWYHEFDGGRTFYTGGGHTNESYSEPLFRKHLLGGIQYAMGAGTLDYSRAVATVTPEENRFEKKTLINDLDSPMELAISPDGCIFFTELISGKLKVYDTKSGTDSLIHQFDVENRGGAGLIGVALDPNFTSNHHLYLYYAPPAEEEAIIFNLSRFTLSEGKILDPASEKVLLKVEVSENSGAHHGGSLAWDKEGNLYLSTGDSSSPFASKGYAPLDERPGKEFYTLDSQRSSANTNDLKGKILRIHPEPDGSYTIPEGNLFSPGTAKTRPEIYIMGARNPYRIAVNKATSTLYWGDIGPDAGKDSIQGPRGYDEFNQAKEAGNFGWPYFMADNQAYAHWDFATQTAGPKFDPQAPLNKSPNNTGLKDIPPAQPAMIWYPYAPSGEFPGFGQGGRSAMAGDFYYFDEQAISEKGFPEYYHGALFVFDWMRNWVMALRFDEAEDFKNAGPFMSLNGDFRRPIDLAFSKEGIMYMLEYGSVYGMDNEDARLVQIEYNRGNRAPIAKAAVLDSAAEEKLNRTVFLTSELRTLPLQKKVAGRAPLRVLFTSRGSGDPDNDDQLNFEWQLEGGQQKVNEPNPVYTYTKPGVYFAILKITDQHGMVGRDTVTVEVGNAKPEISIVSPDNKSFYRKHKPFKYKVEVTDKDNEDGAIQQEDIKVYFDYSPEPAILPGSNGDNSSEVTTVPLGAALIAKSDCKACHTADKLAVGPSYKAIARQYKGNSNAISFLSKKIIEGGSGNWGQSMMSAHPQLSADEVNLMVKYILSLGEEEKKKSLALRGILPLQQHKKDEERGTYTLLATYTDKGANGIRPLTGSEIVSLRPARVATAFADAHVGFERFRNSLGGGGNADYILLKNIDFTGIKKFVYEFSSQEEGAFEVRIDSRAGPVIAKTTFKPTGDWDSIKKLEGKIEEEVSGWHDVYFIIVRHELPNNEFLNFKYINFEE